LSEDDTGGGVLGFAAAPPPRKPPFYAVYFPAGTDVPAICGAVARAGGESYGKWLDNSSDRRASIDCS